MKDIPGYEGLYAITEDGKVWSYPKYCGCICHTGKWLTPFGDKGGYIRIGLRNNNKKYTYRLHRLIALTYIPNPENKPEVNHKNRIKTDNRIENLEWSTRKENMEHVAKTTTRIIKGDIEDYEVNTFILY